MNDPKEEGKGKELCVEKMYYRGAIQSAGLQM